MRCSPRVASRGSHKDAHQARAPKSGSERSATATRLSHAYLHNNIAAGSLEMMVCGPGPPAHAVRVWPVVIDTAWVHSEREEEKARAKKVKSASISLGPRKCNGLSHWECARALRSPPRFFNICRQRIQTATAEGPSRTKLAPLPGSHAVRCSLAVEGAMSTLGGCCGTGGRVGAVQSEGGRRG